MADRIEAPDRLRPTPAPPAPGQRPGGGRRPPPEPRRKPRPPAPATPPAAEEQEGPDESPEPGSGRGGVGSHVDIVA